MYILYILLSLLCALLLKCIVDRRNLLVKMSAYPEVRSTMPFVGNILDYLSPSVVVPSMMRYRQECGKTFKLILGPLSTYVMTTDTNFAKFILTSPKLINKSSDYDFFKNWLGNGLLIAPDYIWHKNRKLLTPAFHFKILDKMVEQFNSNSSILVKKLKENIETEIDIYPIIARYTLDIVCETSLGVSFKAQEENNSKFNSATRTILQIIGNRVYSSFKQSNLLYKFTLDYWREKFAVKYINKITNNIINERRLTFETKVPTNFDEHSIGSKKHHFFLDLLLKFGLSDEQIRDEVNTLMLAGHDTTSSGITFTLYLLSNHLDVQNKLYKEIMSVLESDTEPTYSQLQEMKYLEIIIKEAMRLYPPVAMISRNVYEDINYDGTIIPKGIRAGIFIYGMHRESEYFKDPDSFIPERFANQEKNNISTFSYVPFSAGQRNCIGQKFAMLSMKSAICKIVKNFELLPVPQKKPILSYEIILKSINGVYIKFRERS